MKFIVQDYTFVLAQDKLNITQKPLPGSLYRLEDIVIGGNLFNQHGKWVFDIRNIRSIKIIKRKNVWKEIEGIFKIIFKKNKTAFVLKLNMIKQQEISKICKLIIEWKKVKGAHHD